MKHHFCKMKTQVKPNTKKMKKQLIFILLFITTLSAFGQSDTTRAKVEFKPSGKLWGYAFGDFLYKGYTNKFGMTNTQYGSTAKDFTSFEFRRIYLGYDYNISEKFSTQLLLAYEGSTFTSDGYRSFYIKAANIRWKNIFHNADLVIGQMSTPTFATTSEPVWGYRSLEKTIMDMRKIGGSNDVGISLQGKLNDKGDFGYNIMIGNGSGAKPEADKYKKFYGDVYVKLMDQKILLDVGTDNEWSQASPYQKSKTTYKAFLAYQGKNFTMGLEAFQQVQKNSTIFTEADPSTVKDTVNAVASGISIFARGTLSSKLAWVLRYDYYNPDSKFNKDNVYAASYAGINTESFILAGLDFAPVKNVHLIPNVWYDMYNNRYSATNNLSSKSNDLAFRLTVYYIFK
jgi:hypothetical protein